MTAYTFAKTIRKYTKQNSTTLPDADILLLCNPLMDDLAELIAARDIKGNYFMVPATTNLLAGQREYAFPDDVLDHMFSIEIAFSNQTNSFGDLPFVRAFPDDFRRLGVARTEANIQANYTNGNSSYPIDAFGSQSGFASSPRYEIQRRSLYLLSGDISSTTLKDSNGNPGATQVTNGIRLRYRAYPQNLTDVSSDANQSDMSVDPSTTTFGFPRQFHELWARACSIQWKAEHPGAVPPSQIEANYPNDLEAKLSGIEENDMSGEVIGYLPRQVGWDL
jgi:hypothetical protein